jgi:hypothetical protein
VKFRSAYTRTVRHRVYAQTARANTPSGRDCTGQYKSLTTEARTLTNLLDDIKDKYDKIPENKRKQLEDAYEPCIDVLQELDKLLVHYNSLDTRTKRAWDRLKWDPEKAAMLRASLTSSVTMLNAFYTSLIVDSQVLILEALERLEQDYKGGHREESIASIERITAGNLEDEEEEGDAAWTQILRDLEDVGIAKHDALSHRDTIIGWLVEAVNQGRLLEQRAEPNGLLSMPHDLETALPEWDVFDVPGTHHLDVPQLTPMKRNQSAPSWPPPPTPLTTIPSPQEQRAHSIPSMASLPVPQYSGRSSYAASHSSDTDTSSLYAKPESIVKTVPTPGPSTIKIRRVPVPSRSPAQPYTAPSPKIPATAYSPSSEPAPFLPAQLLPIRQAPPILLPTHAPSPPVLPSVYPYPPVAPPLPDPQRPQAFVAYTAPEVYQPTSAPPLLQTPPSYYDKSDSITADLAWTAQQILAAWSRRDYAAAEKYLEEQLTAVERGQTVFATGAQPDRRILRHLIGVCASYTGNFTKAKRYFESVFNGIYINGTSLDDGDIAAARWLGDVCLHLREHQNCVLAWSVAYEGSLGRYGAARDRTQRIAAELRLLDHWLFAFRRIENAFLNNYDPTDIFQQTHAVEKSNLISIVRGQLLEYQRSHEAMNPSFRPTNMRNTRPQHELMLSEGFLLGPLISLAAWPLQWDTTFAPADAVQLDRYMNSVRIAKVIVPLVDRDLPSTGLIDSNKLHYVTRRGARWLIQAVKQGLQGMCIEHAEHAFEPSVVCCINQHRDGYAFSEGVVISFSRLQFRNVHGLKVTDVKWATRTIGGKVGRDTSDFRDILRGILVRAEQEAADSQTPRLPSETYS